MASNYTVRDIFGTGHVKEQSAAQTPKDDGKEDRVNQKTLWPTHKEDNIDRICKEYGQGTGYAKWQNERYPVKVRRTN